MVWTDASRTRMNSKVINISLAIMLIVSTIVSSISPLSRVSAVAPSAPVLVSPSNNAIVTSTNVNFDWEASNGAPTGYEIGVSTQSAVNANGDFESGIGDNTDNTNFETSTFTPVDGVYYWHVRASDAAGDKSVWSEVRKLTVQTPVNTIVVKPSATQGWSATGTTAGGVVDYVANASSPFQQDALSLKTSDIVASKAVYSTSTTKNLSDMGSMSYWTKQNSASFAAGLPSYQLGMCLNGISSGSCQGFTTLAYEPYVSEGNNAVQDGVWQKWDVSAGKFYSTRSVGSLIKSQGSSTYTIDQIKSEFPDAYVYSVLLNVGSNNPSYDVLADGVQFANTVYDFQTDTPVVLSSPTNLTPATGSLTNDVDFPMTWSAVLGASGYEYQTAYSLNTDGTLGNVIYTDSSASNASRYSESNGVVKRMNSGTPDNNYFWQVRAVASDGTKGPWSAINKVTVDATKPTSPTNGQPNNAVLGTNSFDFTWDVSVDQSNPITYEFQSTMNPAQTEGVLTNNLWQSGTLNENKIRSEGAPDGTWYWQVRARDGAGNVSSWSSVWNVTLDTQTPSVPQNLGLRTSNGAQIANNGFTNSYSVTANWDTVSDASKYGYKYWNDIAGSSYNSEATAYIVDVNGTSNSGVFNQGEGTHYVQVRSYDQAGNVSPWSPTVSVVYDATAPDAIITGAVEGQSVNGIVNLTGNVIDVNPMNSYFSISGPNGYNQASFFADGRSTHSFDWDTSTLANGTYTIQFETRDRANNKDAGSTDRITVIVDNQSTVLGITNLTDGGSVSGAADGTAGDDAGDFIIEGTVGQNGEKFRYWRVSLHEGNVVNPQYDTRYEGEGNDYGTSRDGFSSPQGLYTWETTRSKFVEDATYQVLLEAEDLAGNYTRKVIRVTVNNLPPQTQTTNTNNGSTGETPTTPQTQVLGQSTAAPANSGSGAGNTGAVRSSRATNSGTSVSNVASENESTVSDVALQQNGSVLAAESTAGNRTIETTSGNVNGTSDKKEGSSCSSFLGLCWYWYVPAAFAAPGIAYFIFRPRFSAL